MLLVLDASVIAKWFKEEVESKTALKIREEFYKGFHEIVIPDLVLYELSNALRYDNKFNAKMIAESIDSIFEMDMVITIPSTELISRSVELALKTGITVYDAIYIALAEQINGVFITADESLYKKAKKFRNCRLLSNFYK